eukprot:CAMPEP_0197621732 /NCGR_PEP_ID=MMETSP1338-20131121/2218_1 /TAXON_ID=43686 ORGANISM="Pelagodinium beii, Strain RCC1491" /NCGR_SAMPLE_ID=MMETSP1338 /ASSEMBLY_ACC=CAM_ASM_000754 /LENGTH=640 /DNA_ID=CAMNT_0043191267 /DNA_START=36 /DNA_END=1958 /DNA_ORIENTATION=+
MAISLAAGDEAMRQPVELAAFEQDKENVRPKRSGRSAATLAEVISNKDCSDVDGERQRRKAEFEAMVAQAASQLLAQSAVTTQASSEDIRAATSRAASHLLQTWFSYANWAAEWFPSTPSEERSVLERATQILAKESSCRDDPRNLQLWLRLADMQKEPQEIFRFLWANEIGCGIAMLYEAWSTFLERHDRFSEAEEVVRVGLARSAQPRDRLQSFQTALSRRIQQRLQDMEDNSCDLGETLRPALNPITDNEAKQLHRPLERRPLQPKQFGAITGNDLSATPFLCLDESSMVAETPRASIFDAQADWSLVPAVEKVAQKENDQAPMAQFPWDTRRAQRRAGAAQGRSRVQRHGASARSSVTAPSLPIFVDPEFQEGSYSAPIELPLAPPMRELSGINPTFPSSGLTPPVRRRRMELLGTDKVIVAPQAAEPSTPSSSANSGTGLSRKASCEEPERKVTRKIGTPGAPVRPKGGRRRPREEEEDDSAALLASFSSLRLQEPPAKRVCLPGSNCILKDFRCPLTKQLAEPIQPVLQTPPRRHVDKVQGCLTFEDGDLSGAFRSPALIHSCRSWRSSRASPHSRGPDALPWESDPGFILNGQETGTSFPRDGLSGLNALGSLFGRASGARDGSCSRLLIFED